jgi:bifunctional non-homologous end joining protein LigD
MSKAPVVIEGRNLTLTNLEKALYEQGGFTKGEVIDYYRRVASALLPHLAGRPLTLKRYPNGVGAGYFYEKRCPEYRPEWLKTARVEGRTKTVNYCLANDLPALVWVANLASLELHVLLARADAIDRPTAMVFDLDPGPPAGLLDCVRVALELRDGLAASGLRSLAKVSGGKGLHFYVPLNTAVTFDDTKRFAHALARAYEVQNPARATSNMRKEQRTGKVFIDWSQNDAAKTTVCVYSLRGGERPTVSAPVEWKELERALRSGDPSGLMFSPEITLARVERKGDLFVEALTLKQTLPG